MLKGDLSADLTKIRAEKKENEKVVSSIVENFLYHEVSNNFKQFGKEFTYILNSNNKIQYSYSSSNIKFDEFDKIKYELNKCKCKSANEALKIYEAFIY